jgi:hypothetical protein
MMEDDKKDRNLLIFRKGTQINRNDVIEKDFNHGHIILKVMQKSLPQVG